MQREHAGRGRDKHTTQLHLVYLYSSPDGTPKFQLYLPRIQRPHPWTTAQPCAVWYVREIPSPALRSHRSSGFSLFLLYQHLVPLNTLESLLYTARPISPKANLIGRSPTRVAQHFLVKILTKLGFRT